MLKHRVHWQNAAQQDPFREARLLWFAKKPKGSIPDPDDDEIQSELEAVDKMKPEDVNKGILKEQIRSRNKLNKAMQREKEKEDAEKLEKVEKEKKEADEKAAQEEAERKAEEERLRLEAEEQAKQAREAQLKSELQELDTIANDLDTMQSEAAKIQSLGRRKNIRDAIQQEYSAVEMADFEKGLNLFEVQRQQTLRMQDAALRFAEWKNSNLLPKDFRSFFERFFTEDEAKKAQALASFDAVANDPAYADKITRWDNGELEQASDKIEIVDAIWHAMNGPGLVADMIALRDEKAAYTANMKESMEKAEKYSDEKAKVKEMGSTESQDNRSIMQKLQDLHTHGIMGVTLHSPIEYYKAVSKVWTAFKDGREEYINKRANQLAFSMGKILADAHIPYGNATQTKLSSTLESEFNKEKGEYKEELGDDNFNALVSKFHTYKNDPPKAIAIMEVAASHGWIYDISDFSEDNEGPVMIFGEQFASLTPPHWDGAQIKNYLGTLARQNTAGGGEEREKGKNRIKEQQDPEVYKRRFEASLEGHNYWQAIGIIEACIDRGKLTEVSEWAVVTIAAHLRNNPDARRYMTKPVLEQLGNIHWGEATYATNMITMGMDHFNRLKKEGSMEGPMLGTIAGIEEEILAANGGPMPQSELNGLVAKVLSSKTIEVEGHIISVFRDKYRSYWDEAKNDTYAEYNGGQAVKSASDYWTDGGLLHLPSASFRGIMETGSTGQFEHGEMAENLVGFAILRLQELRQKDPAAAAVYHKHMEKKLGAAMKAAFTRQAPLQLLNYSAKQKKKVVGPLLGSLIVCGFISEKDVLTAGKNLISKSDELKTFTDTVKTQVAEAKLKLGM